MTKPGPSISRSDFAELSQAFGLPRTTSVQTLAGGHIHGTFRLFTKDESFVAQRINTAIFQDLDACESNLRALNAVFREARQVRIPRGITTVEGRFHFSDSNQRVWRVSAHVPNSQSLRVPRSTKRAAEAARAFGTYVATLRQHSVVTQFQETIPEFHNLGKRVAQLHESVETNLHDRRKDAELEIRRILQLVDRVTESGERLNDLPAIAVHNDAKLANVLFDKHGTATHVIDLDTTMPGLPTYDLGELLRSMSTLAPEDCPTLENVVVRPAFVEAVVSGFLSTASVCMSQLELELLPTTCALMAAENAVRMLTDFFRGDQYFPVTHPWQNLDRARVQCAIANQLLTIVPDVLNRCRN